MIDKEKSVFSIINNFRRKIPVDLNALLRELGIELCFANLENNISGIIEAINDGYRIIVNENHSHKRQRFTIAHELGHFIFHRNLIGSGICDNKAYRCEYPNKYNNPNIGQYHETEANKFAVNLLMPSDELEKCREKLKDLSDSKQIELLAQQFDVSKQAMAIRLGISYP